MEQISNTKNSKLENLERVKKLKEKYTSWLGTEQEKKARYYLDKLNDPDKLEDYFKGRTSFKDDEDYAEDVATLAEIRRINSGIVVETPEEPNTIPAINTQLESPIASEKIEPKETAAPTEIIQQEMPEGEEKLGWPLDMVLVGSKIHYQGENYEVAELPSAENQNKYILKGKFSPKIEASKLKTLLETGEANIRFPFGEDQTPESPAEIAPVINTEEEIDATPYVFTDSNKEDDKAETIVRIKETITTNNKVIAAATKRIEELVKEIALDKKRETLYTLQRKLRKSFFKGGLQKEIAQMSLDIDKEENPFKYFLIENLNPKNFKILFSTERKDSSIEDINKITGESGRDLEFYEIGSISSEHDNAMAFSSNGFYLRLKNPDEVRSKTGIQIYDDAAKYDLVAPDGIILDIDMNYSKGEDLLHRKAKEYQEQQINIFDSRNNAN